MDSEELAFYLSLTTMLSGLVTFIARAMLRSNCYSAKCCYGCMECHRVSSENVADLEMGENKKNSVTV